MCMMNISKTVESSAVSMDNTKLDPVIESSYDFVVC